MSVPPARTYIVVAPTDEALQPPKGVTPNFDDPFTLRPYSNVAFSLGMVFTGVFMVARVYTKARIVRKLRWEDYTCILAWLCYCSWSALKFKITSIGGGTHQWNLTSQQLSEQRRYTNYMDSVYSITACFTKISIILLVLRIFCPQTRDRCYWILQTLNFLNTGFYICYLVIPIVMCIPREKIWNRGVEGKCLNIYALYISSSAFNAISDILMFFVPLWRIWNLSISQARKVAISGIFFSGALAVSCSIIRLFFSALLLKSADYTYVKEQTTLWTHAEVSFGIICSCLFVLPRLYRHLASIPPYGSDEYEDYLRRKSSGGVNSEPWTEHERGLQPPRTTRIDSDWNFNRSAVAGKRDGGWETRSTKTGSEVVTGGIDTDIEKPSLPTGSWFNAK